MTSITDGEAGSSVRTKLNAQFTKTDHITVTAAVDLDTMQVEPSEGGFADGDKTKLDGIEAAADVTDATNVVAALDGATLPDLGTPASGDWVLLQDASDSDNLKKADFAHFTGGSGDSWGDVVDADIIPDADGTRDLGSSSVRFAEVHTDSLDLNGTTFTGTTLADPGADRIMIWDDGASAGSETSWGTPANGIEISGTNIQPTTNARTDTITFVIDGGGSAITTGVKGYLEVPFGGTIQQVTTLLDQSGSIVVDVWKDTYANYPPVDADSITASAPPTVSSATKAQDGTLTGWTTSITAGDILGFNVDSITTATLATISIEVLRT